MNARKNVTESKKISMNSKDGAKTLTTPSQNPDFSNGANISTGSTSSYSSISWGADHQDKLNLSMYRPAKMVQYAKMSSKMDKEIKC